MTRHDHATLCLDSRCVRPPPVAPVSAPTASLRSALFFLLAAGCSPYATWPDPTQVFPWVSGPEPALEPWETVRYETGGWTPGVDLQETALYLQKALTTTDRSPPETPLHFGLHRGGIPKLVAKDLVVSFVGDVMWTGGGWSETYAPAASLMDGDLAVANLETPVDPDQSTQLGALGLYAFNSDPSLLDGLPVDVVGLANNHAADAGLAGLEATVSQITDRGMTVVGVDAPPVVAVGDHRIVFFAYTWGLNTVAPEGHDLHIQPFCDLEDRFDIEPIATDIADADADIRIVLVHWGFEYEHFQAPRFLRLARRLIEAGADAVVGTGPHVVQPAEFCAVNTPGIVPGLGSCSVRTDDGVPRSAAVFYSLGNFGTATALHPSTQAGIVGRISFDVDKGATGLDWQAVVSQADGDGQSVFPIIDLLDDPIWASEEARLVQHLGSGWRRD